MASVIAGCAAPQSGARSASAFGGKADQSNVGLATRALFALNANDFATAITLAERAVEYSPRDAGFRALLGNAYFGGGRFASAEAAYRDSLSLVPNQPQVALKRVLVTIAQGRHAEALAVLESSRGLLDPADYGLAMALAGQPRDAVSVLEAAARAADADPRVRQNLALAYALSGDWAAARTVASQDLSADLVDGRIQQWMTFAKPNGAADQVAALTGVRPAAGDPGQPVRLALQQVDTRVAAAAPVAVPAPVEYSQSVAPVAPQDPLLASSPLAPAPPAVAQQAFALEATQYAASPAEPAPQPTSALIAAAAAAAPDAPSAFAAMAALTHQAKPSRKPAARAQFRRAALQRPAGNSTSVVQLGAYGSPQRVVAAWGTAARRYAALRAYSPMSARFNGPKGVVYRLSVHGFNNADQAKTLCMSLRRSGGSCFVRSVAGDVPVRIASR